MPPRFPPDKPARSSPVLYPARPKSASTPAWPGEGQWKPGDLETLRRLGLPRVPKALGPAERRTFLLQLLDLRSTCTRYPAFAAEVRAILTAILRGRDGTRVNGG